MFDRLREDIASIIERDPAARTAWEVLTCYPGLHAIAMHRCAHGCWSRGMKWLGRFIAHVARALTGVEIHPGATIGRRVFIDHGLCVVIGETAVVGDDCTLYQGVTLGGTSLCRGAKRHPTLERGVMIGAGAKVLGAFTVGAGAKVGSNAVVLDEVPAGATATGNPARIARRDGSPAARDSEARLLDALGLVPDGHDPVAEALQRLVDRASAQEHRIARILTALKAAGIACDARPRARRLDLEPLGELVE